MPQRRNAQVTEGSDVFPLSRKKIATGTGQHIVRKKQVKKATRDQFCRKRHEFEIALQDTRSKTTIILSLPTQDIKR
jgi:hypothetical protein